MASSSKLKPVNLVGKKPKQSPSAKNQDFWSAERKFLIDETKNDLVRVSPTTQAVMQALIASAKIRSRDGLIKCCHRATKRFLILEVLNNLRNLIPDIQDIILKKMRVNDFKQWYFEVVTRSCKFYDVLDLWGRYISFPVNSGVGSRAIDIDPVSADKKVTEYSLANVNAWRYGMVHGFYCNPHPKGYMYSYFTKFQQYVFKRVEEYTYNFGRLPISVQCANIEVTEENIFPPHYLIMYGYEVGRLNDPICRRQRRVTDPVEARAYGFFYISNYINQALAFQKEENPPLMFHVGNTTVIAPGHMHDYFMEGVNNSESVHNYLENVEAGKYLSQEGKDHLLEIFLYWDESYTARYFQGVFEELEDNIHENWESNIGDEGMQNLMMD